MKRNEIKELLSQSMSNKILKERKEDLINLMSGLRLGIVRVSITATGISEELSNKIGDLCQEHHNTYACHRVKKTNLDTKSSVSTDITLINNDLFDIPVSTWSTAEKRMNYYTFVIDPEAFTDRVSGPSDSEDNLNDPFFPIRRFHQTIIIPLVEEYGKDSIYYKEIVNSNFNTNATCFGWFNVMEDSSKYEHLENPLLNNEERILELSDTDDEVLNAGLIATLDDSRIYEKDSEYYELLTVYNFAKYRLLELSNKYDVSPKTIMNDHYAEWRRLVATSCLDWSITLSDDVVDYGEELKIDGFILRFICYLNVIGNAILRELDLQPSFDDLDFDTEERFEKRYKEASDTCTYHLLGEYPSNYYEKLMGYEIRAIRKTLTEEQEKREVKTKLFDMLHNSGLAEEIAKIKDRLKEDTEEEMTSADDFKWS